MDSLAQDHPVTATLLVNCRDRTGIVAALSSFVFSHGGNILDADQHAENDSGEFFMRLVWSLPGFDIDRSQVQAEIAALAQRFALKWELTFSDRVPRVVVFATKASHCLYDLLLCQQIGDLGGRIVGVVSNHDLLADVCGHFDVPFTVIPVDRDHKQEAETRQIALLNSLDADVIVLARYMQILSADFVSRWPNKIINIHHSFLPAFAGAKPYHQAKERGVKIIGATAHYVTAELDQGPIIEQNVQRVSHRDEVEDLMRAGRDLERQVLTRAVRLHLQRRVLVSGNRTIVFG
jgi:formyltetrahydrofolate deformylase